MESAAACGQTWISTRLCMTPAYDQPAGPLSTISLACALLQGGTLSPGAYAYLRLVRRAAERGQGGGRKERPFTEDLLLHLAVVAKTELEKEVIDFAILS